MGGARSEERGCWRDGLIFEELLTILHSSHTVLHLISNTGGSNFAISSLGNSNTCYFPVWGSLSFPVMLVG